MTEHQILDCPAERTTHLNHVLTLAENYRTHRKAVTIPRPFQTATPFVKSPSSLRGLGDAVVIPNDATTVHHNTEFLLGKKCHRVS
jgi:2-keto-4-pentenoate hydratase/2-oxohepta-3-ene-1,7-dioic acid hydratase in catechol pathway